MPEQIITLFSRESKAPKLPRKGSLTERMKTPLTAALPTVIIFSATAKERNRQLKNKWLWIFLCLLLLLPLFAEADVVFDGKAYSEQADYIDLGDTVVHDFDAFMLFLDQFPNLRQVDMWQNRMTKEQCDMLAARYPQMKWGWTMVIKNRNHTHLVRTDYTSWSTLHNNKTARHNSEDFTVLKYCWNLKALDVGHNNVTSLDFLYDLPELRVLIIACHNVTDITPIASLKHLEYAELFNNKITDVTPLKDLPHLLDLNLCFNRISDLSPILNLKTLKRLWLYSVEKINTAPFGEGIDALKAALPNTWIDTTHYSTNGGWRYTTKTKMHPHYAVIQQIFGKDHLHPMTVYVPFEDSWPEDESGNPPEASAAPQESPAPAETEAPPAAQPEATPVPPPEAAAAAEPTAEPTAEPSAEPATAPATEPAGEPAAEPSAEPAPESGTGAPPVYGSGPPLDLYEPQDFSDRNYLLPINFSSGTAPSASGFRDDFTYTDSTITVTVKSGNTGYCDYWYADILLTDPSQLRTMAASMDGSFTGGGQMDGIRLAERSGAVVAINGDCWDSPEKKGRGYIVRQGILYQNHLEPAGIASAPLMDVLLIDEDGDFHTIRRPTEGTVPARINGKRVLNAFSFGPLLVENGQAIENYNNADRWLDMAYLKKRQRICICQVGHLHYMVLCCAGPLKKNTGMTLRSFGKLAASLGAQTAYNLDGGDSTMLYFRGTRINEFGSKSQRKLMDIIYFASAEKKE